MQRQEYIYKALICKNRTCILHILDCISDLAKAVDIAERRLKIPRHVTIATIRKIYFEERAN